MTTLKQFQEEKDEDFYNKNGIFFDLDSNLLLANRCYELGKKEMLEMVLEEIEEEDKRWNSNGEFYANVRESLDSLKEKLLALNEE